MKRFKFALAFLIVATLMSCGQKSTTDNSYINSGDSIINENEEWEVCSNCDGRGFFTQECSTCKGKGRIVERYSETSTRTCSACAGTGIAPCYKCENNGYIICPTCYGQRSLRCHQCNQTGYIIMADEPFPCPLCKGNGFYRCHACDGKGRYNCNMCGGKGHLTCSSCGGSGGPSISQSVENDAGECPSCNGSGTIRENCEECDGKGKIKIT